MLFGAVGVKEFAAYINNFYAVPCHGQTGVVFNGCNNGCFKVFGGSKLNKTGNVVFLNNNSHTLLRFAYRKLGSVKAVVFFRYCIKVDIKAVGKLADSNRYATSAEIVTTFNHAACLFVTEKTLEFAFFGGVTLLNLGAAAFKRLQSMRLRRAGSTAAAVTSGTTAEKDYNIAVLGTFTAYILFRCGGNNCADFHAFCGIAVVVNFVNNAGGKSDLVAVRGITCGGGCNDFTLG